MAVGAERGAGFGFRLGGGGLRAAAGAAVDNSTNTGFGTRRAPDELPPGKLGSGGSVGATTFTGTVCGW